MYASLAQMMKDTLMRLEAVLDRPAYNFMIHTSPIGEEINDHYHWHIEIIPKLTKVAGFEWGTGFYINPRRPKSPRDSCARRNWKSPSRKSRPKERCCKGNPRLRANRVFAIIERLRRGTQVVRERSAKPLCVGSIPTRASKIYPKKPNDFDVFRRAFENCTKIVRWFSERFVIFAVRDRYGDGFIQCILASFDPRRIVLLGDPEALVPQQRRHILQ